MIKSWTGQIVHSVVNGLPPLQYFFEKSCVSGLNVAVVTPDNSLHASSYYSEYIERFDLRSFSCDDETLTLIHRFTFTALSKS